MARLRGFSDYRDYVLHAILIVISLILISFNQNKQIESFKMWMVGLICRFQEQWSSLQAYRDLRESNEQLLLENTRLALENSNLYEARRENDRLKELIAFKERNEMKLIASHVIIRGVKGFINGIVLDVGTQDGVTKNMPLVVANGLVGKIYQAGEDQSIAHLLLDRNFRVGAKIQRSRVDGIISWEGGEYCLLKEVPNRSDVQIGDSVITSGYGERFPPGIMIGIIMNVTESTQGMFLKIEVKPTVDFERMEEVFVIAEQRKAN